MKTIKYFLWLCSGSNRNLLEKCPTEGAKYAGIGATIVFTGIFASIAAGYALFTFTNNYWISGLLGLLWGIMIFNLDRYIVSSMRKSDGSWKEIKMALPRIVLAILISVVIAKPLELKVFEKEIVTELSSMNREIIQNQAMALSKQAAQTDSALNQEVEALAMAIEKKEIKRNELRNKAQSEADGTGGTMRRNAGPIYRIKKADADKLEKELEALNSISIPLISQKRTELSSLRDDLHTKIDNIAPANYTGLAARLEALNRMIERSPTIFWANWFILLLFIALETAPVLVKLSSNKGPYDYLLAMEEYKFSTGWIKHVANVNHNIKKKSAGLSRKERDYISRELSTKLS